MGCFMVGRQYDDMSVHSKLVLRVCRLSVPVWSWPRYHKKNGSAICWEINSEQDYGIQVQNDNLGWYERVHSKHVLRVCRLGRSGYEASEDNLPINLAIIIIFIWAPYRNTKQIQRQRQIRVGRSGSEASEDNLPINPAVIIIVIGAL